ncbi:MAG: hypothetical protein JWN65_4107, partial [Solirubrobacterales bacterium]|nr:hypothetical protein [Solirubrobacterales bacterium]
GASVGRGIRLGAAAAMAQAELAAGRQAHDTGTSLLAYLLGR